MRGLYIHIPFCQSKCPYCHFYSEFPIDEKSIEPYFNACLQDIENTENKNFDTIYIGGGTPSAIPPILLEKFIVKIIDIINFSNVEFSVEANPESVTDDFIQFIKSSPITRVSLGVQSFDDRVLKLLGRLHSAKKAYDVCNFLKQIEIDLNIDIIFDIPSVNKETILQTAQIVTDINPAHISAYSYSAEDRNYLTGFNPDDTLFFHIEDFFRERDYIKYETSNFSKNNRISLHNNLYWNGDEYIGIGASAHSMIYDKSGQRIRYSRPANIKEYIQNPIKYDIFEKLTMQDAAKETIITSIRTSIGADMHQIEKRFGKIDKNLIKNIEILIKRGMLEWNEYHIRTTSRGAALSDSLSSFLW